MTVSSAMLTLPALVRVCVLKGEQSGRYPRESRAAWGGGDHRPDRGQATSRRRGQPATNARERDTGERRDGGAGPTRDRGQAAA